MEKKSARENEQEQEAHRLEEGKCRTNHHVENVCGSVMLGKASDQLAKSCLRTEQQVQPARGKVILKRQPRNSSKEESV